MGNTPWRERHANKSYSHIYSDCWHLPSHFQLAWAVSLTNVWTGFAINEGKGKVAQFIRLLLHSTSIDGSDGTLRVWGYWDCTTRLCETHESWTKQRMTVRNVSTLLWYRHFHDRKNGNSAVKCYDDFKQSRYKDTPCFYTL